MLAFVEISIDSTTARWNTLFAARIDKVWLKPRGKTARVSQHRNSIPRDHYYSKQPYVARFLSKDILPRAVTIIQNHAYITFLSATHRDPSL